MGGNTNTDTYQAMSPDGSLSLLLWLEGQKIAYSLKKVDEVIVATSCIALYDEADRNLLQPSSALVSETQSHDETWEQPWGEQRFVRNNYNEISLTDASFVVRFRVFDTGIGFRYELFGEGELTIAREETEFALPAQSSAWWIPALGQNHYEHLFQKTKLPEVGIAHTPFAVEVSETRYVAIHEAALYRYGSMNIVPSDHGVMSSITPLQAGPIAQVTLPFQTPWRTVTISDTPYGLTASRIMLNLNEPSKIEDTSWIQPTKFMGIWWGMFIEHFTWASGDRHGATTANAFRYINACKRLGIPALLIEGWNEGWDGDWTKNGDKMNHMKPYPDFDIAAITSYATSQGVSLIGHHETSGNAAHYEYELPEAYDYYRHFGVRYIKTGYVSPRMNGIEFHSSQRGVEHYQKTVELAAERKIMLDIHEPVKGTGIERTWPNLMTREGVMGQEYEGGAITPEHTTVLPFTRLLAGPLDYTPGLFNLHGTVRKVHSTLAKQLAFYVTMYSPMQMAADLPEHYDGQDAFEFIRQVPTSWETTVPLDGVIGDFYMVARKDRDSDDWFVGAVTDESSRTITLDFSFLPEHRTYEAVFYQDTHETDWQTNPEAHEIVRRTVNRHDSSELYLAPGGGAAIHLISSDDSGASPYPQFS